MKLNGSVIIAELLIEQGVDTIFGYPGGAVLNIYDALYKYRDKIHHILTAHEQGASHAADGYARATGKTGVVIATSGPGATNLVTGIATARQRCFVSANRFYSVMCFFCPLCSQQALPQQLQRAAKGQQRGIRGRFYFVFIQ